jgi:hypothetical protein
MRLLRTIATALISSLAGSVLLAGAILWFAQAGPTEVDAAEPTQLTVHAKVSTVATIRFENPSLSFPEGIPGSETTEQQLKYTVTHTAAGSWSVRLRSSEPNLSTTTGQTIAKNAIHWRAESGSNSDPFSPDGTMVLSSSAATPASGQTENLYLKMTYPGDAQPGDYSGTIDFVLNEGA